MRTKRQKKRLQEVTKEKEAAFKPLEPARFALLERSDSRFDLTVRMCGGYRETINRVVISSLLLLRSERMQR
jgi:hypothetical protein